jgi:beta-lactamase superfamily II metal-dependent hydrolase
MLAMRRIPFLFLLLGWIPLFAAKNLAIHFVDVEGGQATLIVSPTGQSMLVDTGWPGFNGRDADRIFTAAKKAGVKKIDYLLITHYHTDHVGGVTQLQQRIPIDTFIVHGNNTETGKNAEALQEAFDDAAAKGKKLVVKPGDKLPLKGLDIQVLAARGELIGQSVTGGGANNPHCAGQPRKGEDPTENGKSIGFVLNYGKFRFLNLADLTWNLETDLVCPVNRIGRVDLFLSDHHGLAQSNPPALVHGVSPRVIVMNNGARKGGDAAAWKVFKDSPGLEDLWQMHFTVAAGKEANISDPFIANLESPGGQNLLVEAQATGEFRVLNLRNRFEKVYKAR